ncbi:hypothetical protein JB92DRAFT_3140444 [Gautieria morchelliformis]|nr:hypothetical protein JB92DRAFT_3140444 [Gautieria morchelliformis]
MDVPPILPLAKDSLVNVSGNVAIIDCGRRWKKLTVHISPTSPGPITMILHFSPTDFDGTAMPGWLADSDQSSDTDSDTQPSSPSLEHASPTFQSGKPSNIKTSTALVTASNPYVPSQTNFRVTQRLDTLQPGKPSNIKMSTALVTASNPYVPSQTNFRVTQRLDMSSMAIRSTEPVTMTGSAMQRSSRLQSIVTPVTKNATQLVGMKPGSQNHEVSKHKREGKQETPSTSRKRRKVWEISKEEWDVYFRPTGWIRPGDRRYCKRPDLA